MADIRTIRSEECFAGRKFRVVVDEFEREDGQRYARDIVVHPGAAAILAQPSPGELLLLEHYRYAIRRTILEIPAGCLEPGEPPEACARRELAEETGYVAGRWQELVAFHPSQGILTERLHVFFASDLAPGAVDLDVGEILKPVVLGVDDVVERIRTGQIEDGKTMIAVLFARQFGFLA